MCVRQNEKPLVAMAGERSAPSNHAISDPQVGFHVNNVGVAAKLAEDKGRYYMEFPDGQILEGNMNGQRMNHAILSLETHYLVAGHAEYEQALSDPSPPISAVARCDFGDMDAQAEVMNRTELHLPVPDNETFESQQHLGVVPTRSSLGTRSSLPKSSK